MSVVDDNSIIFSFRFTEIVNALGMNGHSLNNKNRLKYAILSHVSHVNNECDVQFHRGSEGHFNEMLQINIKLPTFPNYSFAK